MLRRRSSGVARFSQHMLGHAMDFFIPDVPLEQIRCAGLRLQRGGVGFYPTSGSPFVHLDTGSIRHWPRMTHDQLARVFPDGRTVHVPSDGVPLKGYELARADIERRGNGDDAATLSRPSLLARLFGARSNDEDDEGAAATARETAAPPAQAAAKPAEPVPMPRAKPVASTLQLASADAQGAQGAQGAKSRQAAAPDKAEPKPQSVADIINERGFWGDVTAPQQATPAQIAAINARRALASTDPQSTAGIPAAAAPAAYQALAYAPAPPADRTTVVAASVPVPASTKPVTLASRNSMAVSDVTTVVAKGAQGQNGQVANSSRIAATNTDDTWTRIMILAPSATTSMSTTMYGDTDLTLMSAHFVKPQSVIAMSFSDDPQMGMSCDQFTGSAAATLATQSFVMRTASLR